jgi:hypothetical protein
MRHAEILNDPTCLERGEHLVALYLGGIAQFHKNAPSEEEQFHDYGQDMKDLIDTALKRTDMDDAAYAELGLGVVEARRKQKLAKSFQFRSGILDEHRKAFQPAKDFLTEFAGKPIAAEDTEENGSNIHAFRVFRSQHPERIGGFIIPSVWGNAQLRISGRPDSDKPIGILQVFDRVAPDTYGAHLKIAIAD